VDFEVWTMQIEVDQPVADLLNALRTQAKDKRMPFDAYLAQFVEPANGAAVPDTISIEEFDRVMDELSVPMAPTGSLPADFSRADVYADHD